MIFSMFSFQIKTPVECRTEQSVFLSSCLSTDGSLDFMVCQPDFSLCKGKGRSKSDQKDGLRHILNLKGQSDHLVLIFTCFNSP